MVELAAVDLDRPEAAAVLQGQLNFFADQPAQQRGQLIDGFGDIEAHRRQRLFARKRQQLAHQDGRPVGVLLDLLNVGEGRVIGAMAAEQQVGKSDHRRQQVIKIMGDAAGELADGFHFLGLGKLNFKVPLFRGVDKVQRQT